MRVDNIAIWYDAMARFVFGKSWKRIQSVAISELNAHQQVLILGGGSGAILEQLNTPKITYLELSKKMISQAQVRPIKGTIDWVHADFLSWQTVQKFDAIYCPFFLDVFPESELNAVIEKVKKSMKSGARLYVLDFQRGNGFQRVLTELMVLFFRIFSGLKANRLLNIHSILEQGGFRLEKEELSYGR